MPPNKNAKLCTLKGMRTVLRKKIEERIQKCINPTEDVDPSKYEENAAAMQLQFASLLELNTAIVDHDDFPADNVDHELEEAEDFSERVRAAQAKVGLRNRPAGISSNTVFHSATSTPVVSRSHHVRFDLPMTSVNSDQTQVPSPARPCHTPKGLDISPEVFSGDRLRFRQFMTQFDRWTAKKPDMTPVEKLMVLKKYVSGEPKTLIEPLELSDENYPVAIELLETNFARVDTERQRILAELRNLPRVSRPYDLQALRRLVTTIQRHTASLKSIGVPIAVIALSLQSSIEAALPVKIRQEFVDARRLERRFHALSLEGAAAQQQTKQKAGDNKQDGSSVDGADSEFIEETVEEVTKLIEFLKQRVRDLEDSKFLDAALVGENKENEESSKKSSKSASKKVLLSTVAATTQRRSAAPARPNRPCLFCEVTEHSSARCTAQLTITQRKETLTRKKRCHRCFGPEHSSPAMCKGTRVPCATCGSRLHYTSMHAACDDSGAPNSSVTANVVCSGTGGGEHTILRTASAYIVNGGLKIPIRLFLDGGSELTFINPATRRVLRSERPVRRQAFRIQTFTQEKELQSVALYNIRLQSAIGDTKIVFQAWECEFAVDPKNHRTTLIDVAIRKFNKEFPIADRSFVDEWDSSAPAMLIGMNQIYKLIDPLKPGKKIAENLYAAETPFGWVIGGAAPNEIHSTAPKAVACAVQDVCCFAVSLNPAAALEKLWSLQDIGINDHSNPSHLSADEQSAVTQFNEGLEYDGTRYSVSFPKRTTISKLPNNQHVATQRLERKIQQLQRDPARYHRYDEEIMKFVSEGYATEVPGFSPAVSTDPDGSFYMPHHEVITNTDAGEKWRIVFDGSAKEKGKTSLNDHLLAGPNLNPDLVTLLINFRTYRVAVSADVSKAYMMIAVKPSDRDLFRFLWRAPGDATTRAFRMERVTWGAKSSGFLLAATIREHLRRTDSHLEAETGPCFYADDFLKSFPTEDAAIRTTDKLRKALRSAGMELAKWKSNSERFKGHLAASGVPSPGLDDKLGHVFKVLGISWLAAEDAFLFTIANLKVRLQSEQRLTKRLVLSLVASIFDPLGMLIPYVLRGRRIIQKLWQVNLEWGQIVSEEIRGELTDWISEVEAFEGFRIPRCYAGGPGEATAYRLHIFADASQIAYACCAYIEYRYGDGPSESALVMSKSRLAPRNSPTLPRLELLAALIASRLKNFLIERMNVKFERVLFYTDSMITYHWIQSTTPGSYKTFVANRISEIQTNSAKEDWFFVPGEDNVADIATRGISARSLISSTAWWNAPEWIHLPADQQPTSQPRSHTGVLRGVQNEIRATVSPAVIAASARSLIDLDNFSTAGRAVRVLANVILFCLQARRRPIPLEAELYLQAEAMLIRQTQQEFFEREILAVRDNDKVPLRSKLAAYNLFFDDRQILRARTRMTKGPVLTYEERNPIVLPGESRLAKLYILDAHRINAHFGVNNVLCHLRRRFWITRARQLTKTLLRACVICRKRQGPPGRQIEAPLPEERLTLTAPHAVTGLDFCGPFLVKTPTDGAVKSYCALFTCSTTRAVHLELVLKMSTPQTHLAIRRFLASYPACRHIVSDNGRSFVKAATDIKSVFNSVNDKETRDLLKERNVQWSFICPKSPWHGGFYERLVASVKISLAKTLGRSLVSFEELRTILAEIAATINDRPISYVETELGAISPLTPADFLRSGPKITSLTSVTSLDRLGPDGSLSASGLREQRELRTSYFKHLSIRWYREYLLQLKSANATRGSTAAPIRVGDVCLLRDDNLPRIRWELVKVQEAHLGRDGLPRTYTVRFSNGHVSRRAVQLLHALEVVEPRAPTPTTDPLQA